MNTKSLGGIAPSSHRGSSTVGGQASRLITGGQEHGSSGCSNETVVAALMIGCSLASASWAQMVPTALFTAAARGIARAGTGVHLAGHYQAKSLQAAGMFTLVAGKLPYRLQSPHRFRNITGAYCVPQKFSLRLYLPISTWAWSSREPLGDEKVF